MEVLQEVEGKIFWHALTAGGLLLLLGADENQQDVRDKKRDEIHKLVALTKTVALREPYWGGKGQVSLESSGEHLRGTMSSDGARLQILYCFR